MKTSLKRLRGIYAAQNGQCFYCGRAIWRPGVTSRKRSAYDREATIDHFWPKSHGNSVKDNIVLACRQCNEKKASRAPSFNDLKKFAALGLGDAEL